MRQNNYHNKSEGMKDIVKFLEELKIQKCELKNLKDLCEKLKNYYNKNVPLY